MNDSVLGWKLSLDVIGTSICNGQSVCFSQNHPETEMQQRVSIPTASTAISEKKKVTQR